MEAATSLLNQPRRLGRLIARRAPVIAIVLAACLGLAAGQAGAQTQQDLVAQLLELRQQIQVLTGRVEDLQYRNSQLEQRLDRVTNDLQYRISLLEGGGTSGGSSNAAPASSPAAPAAQNSGAPAAPGGGGGLQPSPGIGPSYDALATGGQASGTTPPASNQPTPYAGSGTLGTLSAPSGSSGFGSGSGSTFASVSSPADLYNQAYARLETGDFAGAQQGFQQFVSSYPSDGYAPNAYFWLGETYYERGMYDQAASSYARGYQGYPSSQVARDTLFKLGRSLAQMGRTNDACTAFSQIGVDFPNTPTRMMSLVDQERQRLGCG